MKQEIAEYFKTQLRRGNVKLLCLLCLLFISCVNKPSDEKKVLRFAYQRFGQEPFVLTFHPQYLYHPFRATE